MTTDENAVPPSSLATERMSPRASHRHFPPGGKGRKRFAVWLAAALLLFAAGCVAGVGVTVLWFKHNRLIGPPRPSDIAASIMNRIDEVLDLTGDERARLEAIVGRRMANVDSLRQRSFADIRAEFTAMSEEMDAVLGPDRSDRWHDDLRRRFGHRQWMKNHHREREMRRRGSPAGRPPP